MASSSNMLLRWVLERGRTDIIYDILTLTRAHKKKSIDWSNLKPSKKNASLK